jgi:hypothetical protein
LGINSDSDRAASLVIGPTTMGMVRVYVEAEGIELPMDFEPAEALEIANELRAAAEQVAAMVSAGAPKQPDKDSGISGRKRDPKNDGPKNHSPKNHGGGRRRG